MTERISRIVRESLVSERKEVQKQRAALNWRISEAEKAIANHRAFIEDAERKLAAMDQDMSAIARLLQEGGDEKMG